MESIGAGRGDGVEASRRDFVKVLPIAGLGAAAYVNSASAQTAAGSDASSILSIKIPREITESQAAPVNMGSYEGRGQTGAQIFAATCKNENLAAMFCAPGNYAIVNEIAEAGILSYGGRSEGAMAMAADGFSRATGEAVACSGTEGPGFTHMIQAIHAASVASTPLLVLASNVSLAQEDTFSSIQYLEQQPLTTGIKKYGKRITAPNRIQEYAGYAFRNLKSGVPGPVHLDFPAEVALGRFTSPSNLTMNYDKSKYRSETRPSPSSKDVERVADMILKAERPLIIAGVGVFQQKGWDALLRVAEKNEIGVCQTGPSRGHFADDHRLSLSIARGALMSADLVVFIGQYMMPTKLDYRLATDIKTIRVHPTQEDLGRNWPLDLGIVSDERVFLEMLADILPSRKRPQWVNEIASARKEALDQIDGWYKLGLQYGENQYLHPAVIGKEMYDFFYNGGVDPKQTIALWGGLTSVRFVPTYLRSSRPGQNICSYYQSGTIGTEIPHGIGCAAAVKEGVGIQGAYKGAPVLSYASDASMAYGLVELETAAKYRLPLITVVYNNDCWGTWTSTDPTPRALHMYLFQENIRYDKMAEGLGCAGAYVRNPEELRAALQVAYDLAAREQVPTLINCQGRKEFTSAGLYPPGASIPPAPNISGISH